MAAQSWLAASGKQAIQYLAAQTSKCDRAAARLHSNFSVPILPPSKDFGSDERIKKVSSTDSSCHRRRIVFS
jgi:hypothetical protein